MGVSTDNKYDVIVIGAGLGGLSCALHLAKRGLHVLVLEKQPKVGGYCQNYLRGDYNFDVSLHVLPSMKEGQGAYILFEYLEVLEKLDVIEYAPMYSSIFPDRTYEMPSGGDGPVLDYLQSCFPDEKEGLKRYFETINRLIRSNVELFWSGDVDFDTFFPTRYYGKTYEQLLNEHVKNPRLHGLLGQLWQSAGLPNSLCAANWGVEVNGWHLISGNFYLRGGGQRLSEAMTDNLRSLGSVVKVTSLVRKVLLDKRRVQGVELENGERYFAPIVVSNANPLQTLFQLIGEEHLGTSYVKRLKSLERSCSLITMYMGLDCPAAEVGIHNHTQFINYRDTNEQTYRLALQEAYNETDFVISNYTDDEGGGHPRGHGVIQIAEIAPGEPWITISRPAYEEKKKRVTEVLLEKLSRHYPTVSDHIQVMELATPRTMSLATRNPGGAVYGFAQTVKQADSSRFGAQSSFKGLYFTGAWCRGGGGGYTGSIINGRVASRIILAREGFGERPEVKVPSFQAGASSGVLVGEEKEEQRNSVEVESSHLSPENELSESGAMEIVTRAVNHFIQDKGPVLRAEWDDFAQDNELRVTFFHFRFLLVPFTPVSAGDRLTFDVRMTPREKGKAQFDVVAFLEKTGKKLIDVSGNALIRSKGFG